jgi:hypothetical protein
MDTYIPDDERVVVLATEGGEVFLVVGEGKALNEDLVELESLDRLECVKVPDDDVCL